MASERLLLAAHQNDAAFVRVMDETAKRHVESVTFGKAVVVDASVGIIAGGVGGPASELGSRVDVADRSVGKVAEYLRQSLLVELGGVSAIRGRADIDDFIDVVAGQ